MSEALNPISLLADATAASDAMRSYVMPMINAILGITGSLTVAGIIYGAILLAKSAGDPEKIRTGWKYVKNAVAGLIIVLLAVGATSYLRKTLEGSGAAPHAQTVPTTLPQPQPAADSFSDLLLKGVVGLIDNVVKSAGKPFLDSLKFFTETTPLMRENPSVVNLWAITLAIAGMLFALVVAILGLQKSVGETLGFDDLDVRQLVPQFIMIALLMFMSLVAIDTIIGLSNAMISALRAGLPETSVWESLTGVINSSGTGLGLATLLVMAAFLILSIILLVYYVLRLVVLYLGAVLSPLILLLWLIPAFKDFAATAIKIYITTIFVLFVHVVILGLAASIFTGMSQGAPNQELNPIMSMVVGLATVLALLKTQGVMSNLSYASLGPKTARKLGDQINNAVNYVTAGGATTSGANASASSTYQANHIDNSSTSQSSGKSESTTVIHTDKSTPSKKPKTGETKRAERSDS